MKGLHLHVGVDPPQTSGGSLEEPLYQKRSTAPVYSSALYEYYLFLYGTQHEKDWLKYSQVIEPQFQLGGLYLIPGT